jgi:hypothetical protein
LDIIQQSKESLQGFSEEKWFIFINYFWLNFGMVIWGDKINEDVPNGLRQKDQGSKLSLPLINFVIGTSF